MDKENEPLVNYLYLLQMTSQQNQQADDEQVHHGDRDHSSLYLKQQPPFNTHKTASTWQAAKLPSVIATIYRLKYSSVGLFLLTVFFQSAG